MRITIKPILETTQPKLIDGHLYQRTDVRNTNDVALYIYCSSKRALVNLYGGSIWADEDYGEIYLSRNEMWTDVTDLYELRPIS